MRQRILVVEDEVDIADLLALHLRDLGWEIDVVHDGARGLERAASGAYDLLILDVMLPGMDGLQICQRVRSSARYVPILMLTARSTEMDRVVGLELGADDYLTKPFHILELVARVRALFRRVDALRARASEPETLQVRDLTVSVDRREAVLGDHHLELTAKEFDLLAQFARNPGRVYTRAELLDLVWGYEHEGYEHTVNSHINRLRAKIEADRAHPSYILTVWGVGYKFADGSPRETE
ncbi:MAG: response regulator transcription factor [Thermoanaerobaculia bacterium]